MKKIEFQNLPSTDTPITAENLNLIQSNVEDVFNGNEPMGSIVVEDIKSKNSFDVNASTVGAYITSAGNIITDSTASVWLITDYIPVIEGEKYTYQGLTMIGNSPYSAYYDSSKTLKNTFKQQTGTNTITIPSGVSYVRFSVHLETGDQNTFQLEKGSVATEYVPYKKYGYNDKESMGKIVVDDISCKNLSTSNRVAWEQQMDWVRFIDDVLSFTARAAAWSGFNFILSDDLTIGKEYTVSFTNKSSDTVVVLVTKTDAWWQDAWDSAYKQMTHVGSNEKFTYTFIATTKTLGLFFVCSTTENADTITRSISEIQLEPGNKFSTYVKPQRIGYTKLSSMGDIIVDSVACKNIFDGLVEEGSYSDSTGQKVTNTGVGRSVNPIPVEPRQAYRFSNNGVAQAVNVFEYKSDGTFIKKTTFNDTETIITSSETAFITWYRNITNTDKVQIEKGTEVTYYVPHKEISNKQIYSTSEQVVGTWMGKPLYRKTLDLTPQISASTTQTSIDLDIQNVKVAMIDSSHSYMLDNVTSTGYMPFPNINGNTAYNGGGYIQVTSGKATLNVRKGSSLAIYKLILTVEYTKTTD